MPISLTRSQDVSTRYFPLISPDLYKSHNGSSSAEVNQIAATRILNLVNYDLTFWQRYRRTKSDPMVQLSRLFLLHKQAISAEQYGYWKQADFFWVEAHADLEKFVEKLDNSKINFSQLLETLGETQIKNPEELKYRVVEELFIDAHCGFFNGYVQKKELPPDSRAFNHFDNIIEILDYSSLSENEKLSLISSAADYLLESLLEKRYRDRANQFCAKILKIFPNNLKFQNNLFEQHFSNSMAKITNGESETEYSNDAEILQKGIDQLEKLHEKYKNNFLYYDLVSNLHYIRSIKLANAGKISDSLLNIQKALTYNPFLPEAEETKEQLVDMMQKFQANIAETLAQINANPTATLSAEGQRMKAEADRGFNPINDFIGSPLEFEIMDGYRNSQAHNLWHNIGLEGTLESQNDQALKLLECIEEIFRNPPNSAEKIPLSWASVSDKDEQLKKVDIDLICNFLKKRLFESDQTEEKIASNQNEISSNAADPPIVLNVKHSDGKKKDIPFKFWIFSDRNKFAKIQASIACTLLIFAIAIGAINILSQNASKIRNSSYQNIIKAVQEKNYKAIVEESERFLANPLIYTIDIRVKQVKELMDEAIRLSNDYEIIKQRDKVYINIMRAVQENDYVTILKETETFLSKGPSIIKDLREKQVKDIYNEAFVKFFIEHQEDDKDGNLDDYIKRYTQISL